MQDPRSMPWLERRGQQAGQALEGLGQHARLGLEEIGMPREGMSKGAKVAIVIGAVALLGGVAYLATREGPTTLEQTMAAEGIVAVPPGKSIDPTKTAGMTQDAGRARFLTRHSQGMLDAFTREGWQFWALPA